MLYYYSLLYITLYYILPPTSHEKVLNARRRPDSRNSRNKVLFTHHDLAAQLRYTGSKPLINYPMSLTRNTVETIKELKGLGFSELGFRV